MIIRTLISFGIITSTSISFAVQTDCSEAYKSGAAKCEQIKCDEKYQSFLGTWTGPMEILSDFNEPPTYRKYQNTVTYSDADCLKNIDNGDTFIIGRQTDSFPASNGLNAKIEHKLLITGKDSKGIPFLRTVDLSKKLTDEERVLSYELVHKNDVAVMSVWQINGVLNGKPYVLETIDAQDWTVANPASQNRRNVTVTLESEGFKRIFVRGYHTKQ